MITFQYTENDKKIFDSNIIKTYREDGVEHCWLWHGYHNTVNYGVFFNSTEEPYAHRFSFRVYKGDIPPDMDVSHICDVRCCVNPVHLELKTHSENLKERGRDGVAENLMNNKIEPSKEEEKTKPMTNIDECARRLIEMCLALGGERAVKEMLAIRFNGYTKLEWSENMIGRFKKKYFCHFNEVLEEYSTTFEEMIKYFKI